MRTILIIYVGGGFYASVNLADFYIPTKYQELEFIIKISRVMLQTKVSNIQTIVKFITLLMHLLDSVLAEIIISYYFSI